MTAVTDFSVLLKQLVDRIHKTQLFPKLEGKKMGSELGQTYGGDQALHAKPKPRPGNLSLTEGHSGQNLHAKLYS